MFFLICHFLMLFCCTYIPLTETKTFAAAHVTLKKSWAVSWDVHLRKNFPACIWLILRNFKLKLSVKMQNLGDLCPSAPLRAFRACLHLSSVLTPIGSLRCGGLVRQPAQKWYAQKTNNPKSKVHLLKIHWILLRKKLKG